MKVNGKLINKNNNIHLNDINKKNKFDKTKINTSNNKIGNFQDILKSKFNTSGQNNVDSKELKISKHAKERIEEREIEMDDQVYKQVKDLSLKLKDKGIEDGLILIRKNTTAFIVNTSSMTVVTAAKGEDLEENVFTNINGAVVG